jgi:hypothetical protein
MKVDRTERAHAHCAQVALLLLLEEGNYFFNSLGGGRGWESRAAQIVGASPDAAHKLGSSRFDATEKAQTPPSSTGKSRTTRQVLESLAV